MNTIDINSDLGESFGNYTCGLDSEVIPLISSANVACGFHASDPLVMKKTVALAAKNHVNVGAHPGFPDLVGFGRRNMNMSPAELQAAVEYQLGALDAFCRENHIRMSHVKPHGAMYNMAVKDAAMSQAICLAVKAFDPDLYLLAPAGSEILKAAQALSLPTAREVFADRGYMDDGTLVPRKLPGAMITDPAEAARRVISMVCEGKVVSVTGKTLSMEADSVCIHGDNAHALAFAQVICQELKAAGIAVRPFAGSCS